MWVESIRYFNGNQMIEYTGGKDGVKFVTYKSAGQSEVGFLDGSVLKIHSPFIEYKSKVCEDDSKEAANFGW